MIAAAHSDHQPAGGGVSDIGAAISNGVTPAIDTRAAPAISVAGAKMDTTVNGGGIPIDASPEITYGFTSAVDVYTSGVTLNNGDTLEVLLGGSAFDTTVNSGGTLELVQGGIAFDTLVNTGGVITLAAPQRP